MESKQEIIAYLSGYGVITFLSAFEIFENTSTQST